MCQELFVTLDYSEEAYSTITDIFFREKESAVPATIVMLRYIHKMDQYGYSTMIGNHVWRHVVLDHEDQLFLKLKFNAVIEPKDKI